MRFSNPAVLLWFSPSETDSVVACFACFAEVCLNRLNLSADCSVRTKNYQQFGSIRLPQRCTAAGICLNATRFGSPNQKNSEQFVSLRLPRSCGIAPPHTMRNAPNFEPFLFWKNFPKIYSPQRAGHRTSINGFRVGKLLHRSSRRINDSDLARIFKPNPTGLVPGPRNGEKSMKISMVSLGV